jgi:penicillin-binding protein 1A
MADTSAPDDQHLRVRRDVSGFAARMRSNWRNKRWFRLCGYGLVALLVLYLLVWALVLRNLPSAEKLVDYQPPLPTMVRGIDGQIVHSYARERRVQLRFVDFPKPMINAFLSAEDKTFWTHGGVDLTGLVGAAFDYVTKIGSGERARGASTITQQVAKNILLTNEYSFTRKFKEMILARRIEGALSKQQILELYLNEIPLGRQSFGVQAASRAYFGKDVGELSLHETAFLAILPKAPETYGRAKNVQLALTRRNWVLDQMVKNKVATSAEAESAKAQPLGIIANRVETYDPALGYFVEEVRRRLIDQYGESADKGPNSIYAGGLWVRTSVDPEMQKAAQNALRNGLLRYHSGKGWRGPIAQIKLDPDKWQTQLLTLNKSINYQDWRVGVVLTRRGQNASIGFSDGSEGPLIGLPDTLAVGDVIAAAPAGGKAFAVRIVPEISGGLAVETPYNGRVVAIQGGFDAGLGSFNRATQAMRQPGSTIKPFVYATGLDRGMTPSTMVLDGTFCVYQGAKYGKKCFQNFGGDEGGSGNHTMRWGLEQSRNLMTVRIANDSGMEYVSKMIEAVGIGKFDPYLAFALGAGETTALQMVNAYSVLANQGVQNPATLIDYVQDRNGKVIWRADTRRCVGCNAPQWDGKMMPRLAVRGKQVMDARTAFQTQHMLEGVVTRGTAVALKDLGLPLFGKTGTTSGPTNVWFVGGSQRYIAGVYMGYDQPKPMGGYAQGGTLAAPIVKQLIQATKHRWSKMPAVAPPGIHMVKVDRMSGKIAYGGAPGTDPKSSLIWEAFKADTEPKPSSRADEFEAKRDQLIAALRGDRKAKQVKKEEKTVTEEPADFGEEQGGVY